MKKLFTLLVMIVILASPKLLAQGYNHTLPQQCNGVTGGVETLTFPSTPVNANSDGTLTITYGYGDLNSSTETIDFSGEGNTYLGTSPTISQCSNTGSVIYTIPQATISTWASSNNEIEITADAASAVNAICSGNSFCIVNATLEYGVSTGPNDAGVAELISPSLPTCSGTFDVTVAVQNFGINQISPVTVNWMIGTTNQTPFVYNGTLDTVNGVGSDTAHVTIGTITLTGNEDVTFWTTMPNNVNDTSNANDTLPIEIAPSLSGTYTIGSSAGADYATFNEAIDDLNQYGVCGPTVFEVEDGVYTEQAYIESIESASDVNTITFKSQPGNSNLAHLTYEPTSSSSTENGTIIFDGGRYVTFDSLMVSNTDDSYGRVVTFLEATYSRVNNCVLVNDTTPTTTSTWMAVVYNESGLGVDSCWVTNNEMHGGSYSVYWYGSGSSSFEYGNEISGNTATGYYYSGIFSYYQSHMNIDNNRLEDAGLYTTGYGIYRYYNDNSNTRGNWVVINNSGTNYGIYLYYNDSDPANPTKCANNFIAITEGTGTKYGLQLRYSSYQHAHNNSINIENGGTVYGIYLYLTSPTAYAGCELIGNISSVKGNGHNALYQYNPGYQVSDYNNFYYPNGTLGYAGTTYQDLEEYQNGTGNDMNSLEVDPSFVSETDLHVCEAALRDACTNVGNPTDIDNNQRIGTPDIGADEFMPSGPINLGLDTTVCATEYTVEINDPVSSIFWSSNNQTSTANSITLNAGEEPVTYNVNVVITTEHCGLAFGSGNVTIVPNVDFDSSATHLCPGETITLDAGGGTSAVYTWTPFNTTNQTVTVSEPVIAIATKNEMGCESSDTIQVTASEAPDLEDMEVCDANIPYSADATVNGGLTYNWSGGASTSSAVNDLSDAGTYTISITDQFGCDYEHVFDLDVIEAPDPSIAVQTNTGNAYTFVGSSSTNVGANATYNWTFGPNNATDTGMIVTHVFPWTLEPSNYQVELVIENQCSAASSTTQVSTTVGVNDLSANDGVKVFPNPITDHAQLKFIGSHSNINIDVLDVTGRVVLSRFESSSNNVSLNVSGLASGSYSIRVSTDQAPLTVIPVIVR